MYYGKLPMDSVVSKNEKLNRDEAKEALQTHSVIQDKLQTES